MLKRLAIIYNFEKINNWFYTHCARILLFSWYCKSLKKTGYVVFWISSLIWRLFDFLRLLIMLVTTWEWLRCLSKRWKTKAPSFVWLLWLGEIVPQSMDCTSEIHRNYELWAEWRKNDEYSLWVLEKLVTRNYLYRPCSDCVNHRCGCFLVFKKYIHRQLGSFSRWIHL